LLFDITDQCLEPILDKTTGAPRMGRNSQDKACAAMLFNNEFNSVERKDKTDRDKEYFPWIRFATLLKDKKEFELEIKNEFKSKPLRSILLIIILTREI